MSLPRVLILALAILACAGCGGGATSPIDDGSGAGMNLRVTSASLSPSPGAPVMGGTVEITVVVANNGTMATPATTYSYSMNGVTSTGNTLPSVAAGATCSVTCSVTSATAHTYPVTVVIDPDRLVNERSESDNSATVNVTWTTASVRNIAVSAVSVVDDTLTVGGTATLNFTLTYDGTAFPSGGPVLRTVTWRIVRAGDGSVVVPETIASFTSASATYHVDFTDADAAGGEAYIFQADFAGTVVESNETDNTAAFSITWDPPSGSG